jgi:hypothetical protein
VELRGIHSECYRAVPLVSGAPLACPVAGSSDVGSRAAPSCRTHGDCSRENGNAQHKRYHDVVGPVAGAASIRVGSVLSAVGAVTEAALAGHRSLRLLVRTSEIMRWGLVSSAHGGLPPPIYSRRAQALSRKRP